MKHSKSMHWNSLIWIVGTVCSLSGGRCDNIYQINRAANADTRTLRNRRAPDTAIACYTRIHRGRRGANKANRFRPVPLGNRCEYETASSDPLCARACCVHNPRSTHKTESITARLVDAATMAKLIIYIIIRHCSGVGAFPRPFCVPNSVAFASLTLQVGDWAIH